MNILPRLKCWVFGHSYRTHQAFTPWSRRVVCDCCEGDWGMNDNVRAFLPWTKDFDAFYERMGYNVRPVKFASRLGPEVPGSSDA